MSLYIQAAEKGYLPIVAYLLSANADATMTNNNGSDAVRLASSAGQKAAADMIRDALKAGKNQPDAAAVALAKEASKKLSGGKKGSGASASGATSPRASSSSPRPMPMAPSSNSPRASSNRPAHIASIDRTKVGSTPSPPLDAKDSARRQSRPAVVGRTIKT
jgi:ankyrin repeat protein